MRSKVMVTVGVSALLLSGCSQSAPAPETAQPAAQPDDPRLPGYPAEETLLGTTSGSGSMSTAYGPAGGPAVAVYLACESDGELSLNVSNSAPVAVRCGTTDEPSRTVFDTPSTSIPLSIDVESVDGPLVWGLVITDAGSQATRLTLPLP